ncbi:hypothetical protein COOONC_13287 [Cooperia oncophora]
MLRSAFVVGASGAVGKQLVDALVSSRQFKKILIIGRREIQLNHENVEQKVIDFDAIENHADIFKDIDVGFCALGTTRAKSGKVSSLLPVHTVFLISIAFPFFDIVEITANC